MYRSALHAFTLECFTHSPQWVVQIASTFGQDRHPGVPPLAVTSAGALLRELGSLLVTAQTEDYMSMFESHENTRRQRRLGSPPRFQQQQPRQGQRPPMNAVTASVGRAVQDSTAVEDGMVVGSVALLHPTLTLVNAITLPLVRDLIPGEDFINTKEEGADAGGGGAPSIDLAAGWQLPGALSVTSLPAGTVLVHGPRLTPSVASPSLQGQSLVIFMFFFASLGTIKCVATTLCPHRYRGAGCPLGRQSLPVWTTRWPHPFHTAG
jgi:hypothetical protein